MTEARRTHILTNFDEGLNLLRDNVLMMASLTEVSVNRAVQALFERNDVEAKICVADDNEIDQLEMEVDRLGVDILIRFGPVASDLRHVVSAMKISQNLERVSDAAVGISRKLVKILNFGFDGPEIDLLRPLAEQSVTMFREGVRCYHQIDVEYARSMKPRDKEVDKLARAIGDQVTVAMTADPTKVPPLLELVFITRHFERIADHATNIAEDVVFQASNEDIRHTRA